MSNDDDVIKSAESILVGAYSNFALDRRTQHIASMPKLLEAFTELANKEGKVKNNKVYLGYITPDDELNDNASKQLIDVVDFAKHRDEYISTQLRLFWTFDNPKQAIQNLEMREVQMMSYEIRPENTAVFVFSMRKDYGIAIMIAAHCLCVSRITGGETTTNHVDMADSDKDEVVSFFASLGLSDGDETLIRQVIEFHEAPMLLKSDFPTLYAELLKEINDKIEKHMDDTEGDDE